MQWLRATNPGMFWHVFITASGSSQSSVKGQPLTTVNAIWIFHDPAEGAEGHLQKEWVAPVVRGDKKSEVK